MNGEELGTPWDDGDHGYPQLLVDHDAPDERRIVITDDFGQRIEMSVDQLQVLIDGINFGVLDLVEPNA
ncbi:MAG TPA: hypothetical protein VHV49_16230 [Pseudonocardiaceae bacterium]|jgi:hypothetical protein|nr:hypothetical protein [Pseudonocardiaceae bacterium]